MILQIQGVFGHLDDESNRSGISAKHMGCFGYLDNRLMVVFLNISLNKVLLFQVGFITNNVHVTFEVVHLLNQRRPNGAQILDMSNA